MPAAAIATLVVIAVLVLALAGYLSAIAWTLRAADRTLGQVAAAVQAIAERTEPLNAAIADVNAELDTTAGALEAAVAARAGPPAAPRA